MRRLDYWGVGGAYILVEKDSNRQADLSHIRWGQVLFKGRRPSRAERAGGVRGGEEGPILPHRLVREASREGDT